MKDKLKNKLENFINKDNKVKSKSKKPKVEAKVIDKPLILEDGRQLLI